MLTVNVWSTSHGHETIAYFLSVHRLRKEFKACLTMMEQIKLIDDDGRLRIKVHLCSILPTVCMCNYLTFFVNISPFLSSSRLMV